jgi:hypothetical protein
MKMPQRLLVMHTRNATLETTNGTNALTATW